MNQKKLISLIVLAVLALISQFFTSSDKKEERSSAPQASQSVQEKKAEPQIQVTKSSQPTKNGQTAEESLGDYDVHMKNDRLKQNLVVTDYYMLALSWSPAFCQSQKRNNNGKVPQHLKYQCDGSQQFGWVIHGLWPQSGNARGAEGHPRYCQGDLPMVAENTIKQYLPESPGATLLQGEWEKHGACAFNQAEDYFAMQKKLFKSLNLPNFATPKSDLFKWMKAHNPQLNDVFLGSGKDELYICYDKQWQPMDCPR